MKKIIIVLFSLLFLVSCSTDTEDEATPNNNQEGNNVTQENDENHSTTDDSNTVDNEHLKAYEEFDILSQELDLNLYEGIVETDNRGNRVILFQTEEGTKEYKSIYVKDDHHLKIVHFNDEDNLLYNDVIQ